METGIDNQGNEIHYRNAIKGKQYICPYCTEKLILRTGQKPCFAHNVIRERTPLQRTCPEYHENDNYKRINDISDIIYIENGGIPLYLCNNGDKYELRAFFPSISESCMNNLKENNTDVIINKKKWCNVENLSYYPVRSIVNWIDVEIKPSTLLPEVKRKWLWGIRGIDIEKDIYNYTNEGGHRIAIKSNIYVGKKYRMMFAINKLPENINGIIFKNIGNIKLRKGVTEKLFFIYDIDITMFTEEARQFIESKGYHLKQKDSKLIPIWPPTLVEGNNLKSDSNNVWLYHSKKNSNEYVYEVNGGRVYPILGEKILKVANISRIQNRAILITNKLIKNQQIGDASAEIKYTISYKEVLNNKKYLEPQIVIKDTNNNLVNFKDSYPKGNKFYIESNVPVTALVMKNNYCIYSSSNFIEEINSTKDLIIDCKGFGTSFYSSKPECIEKNKVNWDLFYMKLYNSKGPYVIPSYKSKVILYKIQENISIENYNVYNLLYTWIFDKRIPNDAQLIINKYERKLLND